MSKTFSGQPVLNDVQLSVNAGEIRALLGQNGSGKSTLVKVLSGYHVPDRGSKVLVRGIALPSGSPTAAHSAGLRFVHQDLGLVEQFNVTENIAMATGFRRGRTRRILWKQEREEADSLLASMGYNIDVEQPVGKLSAVEQTGVAIARALRTMGSEEPCCLVLDEPTASLPRAEVQRLLQALRMVASAGTAVLLVSHRLEEVLEIADTVTVLRDGNVVATHSAATLSEDLLVELITGERTSPGDRIRATVAMGSDVLTVRGLSGPGIQHLDLTARSGEIIGVSGLTGSGREHLCGIIFGSRQRSAGSVEVSGRALPVRHPRDAVRAGIGLVPSDRRGAGVVAAMSAQENLTLANLRVVCRRGRLQHRRERLEVKGWFEDLAIKPLLPSLPISRFSGGNQQKMLIAKWLRCRPTVLLLEEPTQGVDVGAKEEIYRILSDAARGGTAVIVSSSDDDELASICTRVLVLTRGVVAGEFQGPGIESAALAQAGMRPAPTATPVTHVLDGRDDPEAES